jgi:hypothetical protein
VADESLATHRRYCFLRWAWCAAQANDLDPVWDDKRRSIPGTDIPSTFPAYAALTAAGYLVLEELLDVTDSELIKAGLTQQQAAAVIAALE